MRNAVTVSLGIVLLVATALFSEPGSKHAEEQRLGQEVRQVVISQEEAPVRDVRWEASRRGSVR